MPLDGGTKEKNLIGQPSLQPCLVKWVGSCSREACEGNRRCYGETSICLLHKGKAISLSCQLTAPPLPPHSRQEEGHFQPPGDVQERALQGAAVEMTAKVLLGAACSLSNPSIQPWMHYQTHTVQDLKRETISLLICLLPLHILNFAIF